MRHLKTLGTEPGDATLLAENRAAFNLATGGRNMETAGRDGGKLIRPVMTRTAPHGMTGEFTNEKQIATNREQ